MNIGERLNKLRPYVLGLRFSETSPLIDCLFKEFWTVKDSDEIAFAKTDVENQYICYTVNPSVNIDNLLDYIESLIKYNLDEESKVILFKEKMQELKNIFEQNNLKTLQNLRIVLSDDKQTHSPILNSVLALDTKPKQSDIKQIITPPTHTIRDEYLDDKEIPSNNTIRDEYLDDKELPNDKRITKPVCRCVGNERCSVCLGIDLDDE